MFFFLFSIYILFYLKKKVIIAEKRHDQIINEVETFKKCGMNHVETAEHNPLPTIEGLLD